MMRTRRLLGVLALLLVLAAISGSAAETEWPLAPEWSLGYVSWMYGPAPPDADAVVTELESLARAVLDLWALPSPSRPEPPEQTQTGSETAAAGDQAAKRQQFWAKPMLSWNGIEIPFLTVCVFPDAESLNTALRRFDVNGLFTKAPLIGSQPWVDRSCAYAAPAILAPLDRWRQVLVHQLAYWVFDNWLSSVMPASYEEAIPVLTANIPHEIHRMLVEGFAEYTAWALGEKENSETIAASWAAEGSLDNVPPPLFSEVGESLFRSMLPDPIPSDLPWWILEQLASWTDVAEKVESEWRRSLADIGLTEADRVDALARRQLLGVCARILEPVLTGEAAAAFDRLSQDDRSLADIDRFWETLSNLPTPDDVGWDQLALREQTYGIIAKSLDHPNLYEYASQQSTLTNFRAARDWDGYLALMIAMLRDGIAFWGL